LGGVEVCGVFPFTTFQFLTELVLLFHSEFLARSVIGLVKAVTKPAWRHSLDSHHAGCQIGHRSEEHMFELMKSVPNQFYNFTHAIQVRFFTFDVKLMVVFLTFFEGVGGFCDWSYR
jgi:hypothetical protein